MKKVIFLIFLVIAIVAICFSIDEKEFFGEKVIINKPLPVKNQEIFWPYYLF